MIIYKSPAEIDLMREAGAILAETLGRLQAMARPGVTLLDLDREAGRFIRERGCIPGFVGYQGYQNSICTSVNDQVVHGIPTNRKLREGDLLSLDAGLIHRGFWADSGLTVAIGKVSAAAQRLLEVTRESLAIGISQAQAGNRIGDISAAIQQHVEQAGFSVVRQFAGRSRHRPRHARGSPGAELRDRGPGAIAEAGHGAGDRADGQRRESGRRPAGGRMDRRHHRPQSFRLFRTFRCHHHGRSTSADGHAGWDVGAGWGPRTRCLSATQSSTNVMWYAFPSCAGNPATLAWAFADAG